MGIGQVMAVAVLALLGPCPPVPHVPPPDQYTNRILRRKQTLHAGQVLPSAAARGGAEDRPSLPGALAAPHAGEQAGQARECIRTIFQPPRRSVGLVREDLQGREVGKQGCPTSTLAVPHARCAHTLNVLRGGSEASSGPPRSLHGGFLGAYPLKPRGDAEILDQMQEELLRRRDGQRSPSPPIFTWSSAGESLEGAERPIVSAREAYAKAFRFDRCACACDVRVSMEAHVYRCANPCPPAREAHFQP